MVYDMGVTLEQSFIFPDGEQIKTSNWIRIRLHIWTHGREI